MDNWPLLQGLLGFTIGYTLATLIESYMHQHVSDAPAQYVTKWKRYPRLFRYLIRTRYSHHIIHHSKTFKINYVKQFVSKKEQEELDDELRSKGKHGDIIMRSNYAIKLHGSGSLVFIAPLVPAAPLIYWFLGIWGAVGGVIALSLPPLFSNFVHPYLHMPHHKAVSTAPFPLSWLLKTRYFRAMARNHYMHHKYLKGNYNLLLGGDLIRGAYKSPSKKDIAVMADLGLPVH